MNYSRTDVQEATTIEVTMPDTGSKEASVVAWLKRPGEAVNAEEPICLVAWDEFTAEVTSPTAGVLRMLAVASGERTATGSSLAVIDVALEVDRAGEREAAPIDAPGERVVEPEPKRAAIAPEAEPAAFEPEPGAPEPGPAAVAPEPVAAEPEPAAAEPEPVEAAQAPEPVEVVPPQDAPIVAAEPPALAGFISPAVRRFALEHGIDPTSVPGTGREGRVTLADVRRA